MSRGVQASRCASGVGPVRLDQQPMRGTLSSLRRAGELSWQRICSASAYEGPYVDRSDVTATYRAVGPGIHGRCVGAMELHSRHPVKGGMIAAFRVRPRPRGSQAAWRSAGSRRGGRQRHAGQAPLARGGGPFGERRRSGDAARSRCSKQATASNASDKLAVRSYFCAFQGSHQWPSYPRD
jgi:hypothetical protein